MSPLARAGAFLTGAIAVVAGLGSGNAWLNGHFKSSIVYFMGLVILALAGVIVAVLAFHSLAGRYRQWHWFLYISIQVFTILLISTLLSLLTTTKFTNYFMAYFFVFIAVIPILGLLYQLDKVNNKSCPMCCERIKSRARICHHCGSRLASAGWPPFRPRLAAKPPGRLERTLSRPFRRRRQWQP